MRSRLLLPVVLAGCAGAAPAPIPPAASAPRVAAPAPKGCPARVDVAFANELLEQHARSFGTMGAVEAALPVTLAGTVTVEGRAGTLERNLTADAARSQASLAGIHAASGTDAEGAWTLEGGTGVVERLTTVEGTGEALDAWLLRRAYTANFAGRPEAITCKDSVVTIAFARPELGSPTLTFDRETAALLATWHRRPDGNPASTTYEAWGEPDHGVRWPRRSTDHPAISNPTTTEITSVTHRLTCTRVDPSGAILPEQGPACAAPPPGRFLLRWPAADALGRTVVRVPFTYLGGEILVRAKVGGREVNALLDSGAGVTAVDALLPAGASFRPSLEVTGVAATQKVRLGFGELSAIELGDLRAEHVPTVSVPIPALETFGAQRPELILGYSFFASAVIRVDYIRHEVLIAKSADGSFTKAGAPRSVPLRILGNKMVVDGVVEGMPAAFQVDTGSNGGLDLYKSWTSAHDLPGSRPVVTVKGKFGAGTEDAAVTYFGLGKASLGPIALEGRPTHVVDSPGAGSLAGLAGNEVLARCDAVLFDVPKRQLWVEGACDRPIPERRVGWRFEKRPDPAQPDRPWVVSALWPDGPAERAGIKVGDRILEVGPKPATLDVGPLWTLEQQPAGTKLPIVFTRAGKRDRVIVELRTLSP